MRSFKDFRKNLCFLLTATVLGVFIAANLAAAEDNIVYTDVVSPTPGNVLVTVSHLVDQVQEYQPDGTFVQTITVDRPDSVGGSVGGMSFDENGLLWFYNGDWSPYLSSWNEESDTWAHYTYESWYSFLCFPCQGIATFENFVFVSDWGSFGDPNGILRFKQDDETWVRFSYGTNYSSLAIGLNGLLYARRADEVTPPPPTTIDVFDPVTLELLDTITLSDRTLTIVADDLGQIYGASYQSILRFDVDGKLIDTHQVIDEGYLYTISLSENGKFVVVGHDGEVVIVNEDLVPLSSFRTIYWSMGYATIVPEPPIVMEILIDIKPNKTVNKVRLDKDKYIVVVAILSTDDFDARDVDPASVEFAGAAPTSLPRYKDVDRDGYEDNVFRFLVSDTNIQCGDEEATLTGTWEGNPIVGTDSLVTVHCH